MEFGAKRRGGDDQRAGSEQGSYCGAKEADGPRVSFGEIAAQRGTQAERGGEGQRTAKSAKEVARAKSCAVEQPCETRKREEEIGHGEGKGDSGDAARRSDPNGGGDERKRRKGGGSEPAGAIAGDADGVTEISDLRDRGAEGEPAENGRRVGPLFAQNEANDFDRDRNGDRGKWKGQMSDDVGTDQTLLDKTWRRGREA